MTAPAWWSTMRKRAMIYLGLEDTRHPKPPPKTARGAVVGGMFAVVVFGLFVVLIDDDADFTVWTVLGRGALWLGFCLLLVWGTSKWSKHRRREL